MKMKGILVVAGLWVAVAGAYAQKGVDNGTRYGSGEDSIRCLTNISLFVPYAKVNNYRMLIRPGRLPTKNVRLRPKIFTSMGFVS